MEIKRIDDPVPTFIDNAEEWRRDVPAPDYIQREIELEAYYPSRYWGVLVNGELVAHCRACIRQALVNGEIVKEACIGNVFTLPQHRGNKYASKLLQTVTDTLVSECELVSLWSDVGDYYKRFGYEMIESPKSTLIRVEDLAWPEEVMPISRSMLPEIVQLHHRSLNLKKDTITVYPELKEYDLWALTSLLNARILGVDLPDIWGAKLGDAWCCWAFDLGRDRSLTMLTMDGGRHGNVEPLLRAAHSVAARVGLKGIDVYEDTVLSNDFTKLGGAVKVRTGSLPMYISKYQWTQPGKYSWY